MNIKSFMKEIKGYQGCNVFNPYSDKCELYDLHNAPEIRAKNLESLLNYFYDVEVDSIWIGRDLGHRGGRRTGLALTDEAHLQSASIEWGVNLMRATKGILKKERTATNIWSHLQKIDEKVFMWNVFPFHPYEKSKQFTNRCHTAAEREIGLQILESLVSIVQPNKIVAIGNDAFNCASRIFPGESIKKVRHPSYGGEKIFSKQLCDLYNIKKITNKITQPQLI